VFRLRASVYREMGDDDAAEKDEALVALLVEGRDCVVCG
jgi:hypothetical protein